MAFRLARPFSALAHRAAGLPLSTFAISAPPRVAGLSYASFSLHPKQTRASFTTAVTTASAFPFSSSSDTVSGASSAPSAPIAGSSAAEASSTPSVEVTSDDPAILRSVAEEHASVLAQVDALVSESGASIFAVPVTPPRQTVAHVFLRFDVSQRLFDNSISISLPETTPSSVVQLVQSALCDALKDRPDGLSFEGNKLPTPEFSQTGANWNRFQYSIAQREVDGALDPYVVQAICLDALLNRGGAKIVSSNSLGIPGSRETVTYVLTVNVEMDCVDYNGAYKWNALS